MKNKVAITTVKPWLEQMAQVCEAAGIAHMDILLDQAAWINAAMPMLQVITPAAPWFSLFDGTPEEHLLHKAPLLIRLTLTQPQHRVWLVDLLSHCARERMLMLVSPLPFEELSKALGALSQARRGGRGLLLRYYDPRVFPLLVTSILTAEQRAEYHRVACYWTWLDRDDQPRWLLGSAGELSKIIPMSSGIELSDQQCDELGCISEAQQLMQEARFSLIERYNEARFAYLYKSVRAASAENYFGDLAAYVEQRI